MQIYFIVFPQIVGLLSNKLRFHGQNPAYGDNVVFPHQMGDSEFTYIYFVQIVLIIFLYH